MDDPLYSFQKQERTFKPDFLFIRNFPTDLHSLEFRNELIGLLMCDIPCVNPIQTVLLTMDRPVAYAELLKIRKRLGPEKFPLVPLQYHCNNALGTKRSTIEIKHWPVVIKVGSTHAGYGKIIVHNKVEYEDLIGILALEKRYFTVEGFIEHEYEYRIQKIGNHYRTFKRNSDTHWKSNHGNIKFEAYQIQDKHKEWADECAKMFGGLDIFAIDVLHTKDGKEYILEINDGACGLWWEVEQEDLRYMKDCVIQKMDAYFSAKHGDK